MFSLSTDTVPQLPGTWYWYYPLVPGTRSPYYHLCIAGTLRCIRKAILLLSNAVMYSTISLSAVGIVHVLHSIACHYTIIPPSPARTIIIL
jgi:hypothetical protein